MLEKQRLGESINYGKNIYGDKNIIKIRYKGKDYTNFSKVDNKTGKFRLIDEKGKSIFIDPCEISEKNIVLIGEKIHELNRADKNSLKNISLNIKGEVENIFYSETQDAGKEATYALTINGEVKQYSEMSMSSESNFDDAINLGKGIWIKNEIK